VDTTPPGLRELQADSSALAPGQGVECRLEVRSRREGSLALEATRGGHVLARVGPRPIEEDQTVHWSWDGGGPSGRPVAPGLYTLRARVADVSGNVIVRERSCWVGHLVGRTVPRRPRPGDRIRVHLTGADGAAVPPGTPVALALYRRTATPGRSLASPLGRRVGGRARGHAARVTIVLPRRIRPSALWLVASSHGRRALVPLGSG
jgi:hypothetical protein